MAFAVLRRQLHLQRFLRFGQRIRLLRSGMIIEVRKRRHPDRPIHVREQMQALNGFIAYMGTYRPIIPELRIPYTGSAHRGTQTAPVEPLFRKIAHLHAIMHSHIRRPDIFVPHLHARRRLCPFIRPTTFDMRTRGVGPMAVKRRAAK